MRRLLLLGLALGASQSPRAAEPVGLDASREYLVGLSLVSSGDHVQYAGHGVRLRPLAAFQLGRFRLANSGASELMSVGREQVDPGVSTVLLDTSGWKISTSLRLDDKRRWSEDSPFSGLPGMRRTLRGRVNATGELAEHTSWSLGVSQDLLGRGGGLLATAGLGYRHSVSDKTYWDVSLGVGWGNALYRQTRYGIAEDVAALNNLTPYAVGAGWDSVSLGWSLKSALSQRWVVFGGLGASQLLGTAASSPLVHRTTTLGANIGLAYRNL